MDSLTSELIKIAIKSEDEMDKKAIADRLLSLIHQRYPRALRSAAELLSVENESLKEVLDQLVITLSTVITFIPSPRIHAHNFDRLESQVSQIAVKKWISSFRRRMLTQMSGRWL